MTAVNAWRDNLNIGLFLVEKRPWGATLDDILEAALGYDPSDSEATSRRARFASRFRRAQSMGMRRYHDRIPGYFTLHAQRFGSGFVYRALWYVWANPQSHNAQAVLVASTDFAAIRAARNKDLATRTAGVRGVAAADDHYQRRDAIARGDIPSALAIEASMIESGTLGELLTNQLGLPYAEMAPVLERLALGNPFTSVQIDFVQQAKKLRRLESNVAQVQTSIGDKLLRWVNLTSGMPADAQYQALKDARRRMLDMGGRDGE